MNNDKVRQSPNFKRGAFRNISPTPVMAEDVSYFKLIRQALNRPSSTKPRAALPSKKTDISERSVKPVITWFGHSSYLIQVDEKNILVDPVLSGHASPFSWMVKAFPGTDVYLPEDLPAIDVLIITHNHYDHLDNTTIGRLKTKIREVYTPLGAARDIKHVPPALINELDWWQTATTEGGLRLTALPARHFSGRGVSRGGSLWASFVLEADNYKFYIGGDSGYDEHFREIGERYGPFDIAILECGQYNVSWPYIHMMPEETVQAAKDLRAKVLLPVHWGKFTLAIHPWNEPVKRLSAKAKELHVRITTPMIGEQIILDEKYPDTEWWEL